MITFKYKFYERSPDGLLREPPKIGPYYEENDILCQYFDTELEAKNVVLSLSEDDEWDAVGLVLVQVVVHV